jgi:hypothetical protein
MKYLSTFKSLFKSKNKIKPKTELEENVDNILQFLKDNNILTWTDFKKGDKLDKWALDNIIKSSCKSKSDIKFLEFHLRLKLSNINELNKLLNFYLSEEEYERCEDIKNEILNKSI